MGLFGALNSGVSGLTAQSSAMGAIADNITNVNTIGYKGTQVNFQTLVTRQTSSTFFSAGGVQSAPRTDAGIQGLLQSSTSQTDISISGSGFFVVNEASSPTISDEFLFTRAGSFFQDNEGFLRNTAGFYLQAFPVDANGAITPNNEDILIANTNVISTDFLTTVNLNRVGGTATATSTIAIGANLPANATDGQTHRTDVQLFDTLGNANNVSFEYTRANRENQWDVEVVPPSGTAVLTLEDSNTNAVSSIGQIEFTGRPAQNASVTIDGVKYVFDARTFSTVTSNFELFTATAASTADYTAVVSAGTDRVTAATNAFTGLAVGDQVTIAGFADADNNATVTITAIDTTNYSYIEFDAITGSTTELADDNVTVTRAGVTGNEFVITDTTDVSPADNTTTINTSTITADTGTFSGIQAGDLIRISNSEVTGNNNTTGDAYRVIAVGANGDTLEIDDGAGARPLTATATPLDGDSGMTITLFNNGAGETSTVRRVDVSTNTTVAQDVASLISTVQGFDSDFDSTNNRILRSPGSATTILFTEDGTGDMVIDPSGLLLSDGTEAANQNSSFTVRKIGSGYRDYEQIKFNAQPVANDTMTINNITYTFVSTGSADSNGGDRNVFIGATLADTLADLEAAIEGQDPQFAQGANTVRLRDHSNNGTNNTLVLEHLSSGSYTVEFSVNFADGNNTTGNTPTEPDGTATYSVATGNSFTVDKSNAIVFDSSGLPTAVNIAEVEILDFSNGAANFDDDSANTAQIALDFGTVGSADGVTQFGSEFTPVFISQDGSQFGTFAGVTIADDGLVTALFDNGETRPVFQIPLATFTNVNELGTRTGNVYNSTQASGDPTLRIANSGPAGAVTQGALEQSTVDIGEEFTRMIVVQRAYSSATRIITTTDEMLEELVRLRR